MHLPNYNLPISGPFKVHFHIKTVMGVTEYIIIIVHLLVHLKIKRDYRIVFIDQLSSFVTDYEKMKIKKID